MNLNKKLVSLRKEKGMSQLELADALDVSRQAISRWEGGKVQPSLENLCAISELYGVPLDGLIGDGEVTCPMPVSPIKESKKRHPFNIKIVAIAAIVIIVIVVAGVILHIVPVKDADMVKMSDLETKGNLNWTTEPFS